MRVYWILSTVLWILSVDLSLSGQNTTDGFALERSQALLQKVFDGYDKKLPPNFEKTGEDRRVRVEVNVFINSMFSVRESSMDYSMSMFLRERWLDDRFKFDDINDMNLTRIELDNSMFDNVWVPDMYILNEKSSHFHEVTVPNKLIHIYPDGQVQYSMRVTGVFSCLMFLQKYPFDTQECTLELESYGHSTDSIDFFWSENPVSLTEGIKFPEFELVETTPYSCAKVYYGIEYPCIGLKFELERSYGYYIIQIYIPSVLIVVLSWVNFWLDCTSVPARISLGLLTVLTMTTQSAGARADLPRVSYIKAIDVWMAVCLAFVFLGLVEFAYVNVHSRRRGKYFKSQTESSDKRKDSNSNLELDVSDVVNTSNTSCNSTKSSCSWNLTGIDRARAADKLSRVLFPAAFMVFNIVYWVIYFLWTPSREGQNLYQ